MKTFLLLSVLSIVGFSSAGTSLYPRGCIYTEGRCVQECEVGTYAYSTGCGYLVPEPTCDDPTPKADTRGTICDFSDCYCDPPTVRNEAGDCVPIDECPKTTK